MSTKKRFFLDEQHNLVPRAKAAYILEVVRTTRGRLIKETWRQVGGGTLPGPHKKRP
ncbi:MAG: hypothetical protein LAO77_02670 [Acidobacteriia bacterium]|nr:hypothetical protein [Terriglobia bacterium]